MIFFLSALSAVRLLLLGDLPEFAVLLVKHSKTIPLTNKWYIIRR
jgi:hypothetical protein